MNDSNGINRRNFIKKTALAAGAITILTQGVSLGDEGSATASLSASASATASSCPNVPLLETYTKTIWIKGSNADGWLYSDDPNSGMGLSLAPPTTMSPSIAIDLNPPAPLPPAIPIFNHTPAPGTSQTDTNTPTPLTLIEPSSKVTTCKPLQYIQEISEVITRVGPITNTHGTGGIYGYKIVITYQYIY